MATHKFSYWNRQLKQCKHCPPQKYTPNSQINKYNKAGFSTASLKKTFNLKLPSNYRFRNRTHALDHNKEILMMYSEGIAQFSQI